MLFVRQIMRAVRGIPDATFTKFVRFVLGYNVATILWGSYVRASFSGDGCGEHWPTCAGGNIVPHSHATKTIVEFTHRMSSGLSVALILVMAAWAFIAYPRGHDVRKSAIASLFLIFTEAALGAWLVLSGFTAHNPSQYRVVPMTLHLINTLFLLTSITLTMWWSSGGGAMQLRRRTGALSFSLLAIFSTILLGISGAVAALGDMLYPARSLMDGIHSDFAPGVTLLLRLRPLHPFIAIAATVIILLYCRFSSSHSRSSETKRYSKWLSWLVGAQLLVGSLNLRLLAPAPMQILHLYVADLLWIALILLSASTLAEQEYAAAAPSPSEGVLA